MVQRSESSNCIRVEFLFMEIAICGASVAIAWISASQYPATDSVVTHFANYTFYAIHAILWVTYNVSITQDGVTNPEVGSGGCRCLLRAPKKEADPSHSELIQHPGPCVGSEG